MKNTSWSGNILGPVYLLTSTPGRENRRETALLSQVRTKDEDFAGIIPLRCSSLVQHCHIQNKAAPRPPQDMCVLAKSLQSCLTLRPHGLQPSRVLCPWDFPGKNTGVGCHALLQGIFQTQKSNPNLSCIGRHVLYHQRHLGSPRICVLNTYSLSCFTCFHFRLNGIYSLLFSIIYSLLFIYNFFFIIYPFYNKFDFFLLLTFLAFMLLLDF